MKEIYVKDYDAGFINVCKMFGNGGYMKNKVKEYGYVRVSHRDQNEDRQLIAMASAGVKEERIYIDRLGRDYNEVLEQWRVITK